MATTFHLPSTSPSLSATSTPAQAFSPSEADSDDEYDLPYPQELQRSAFLAEDFNPQTYLSTLRNRHQTLEDLRSDLRQRSQLLNKELLDLVNGNYEEFLSLGAGLRGGEEKVEGVRVGVLGFGREIDGIKAAVDARLREVEELMVQKKEVRKEVTFGRAILELGEMVADLEDELKVGMHGHSDDRFEDDEDENSEVSSLSLTTRRLRRLSAHYQLLIRLRERISGDYALVSPTGDHPSIASLNPRILELRRLMQTDLTATLRQAKSVGDSTAVLEIMRCSSMINASSGSGTAMQTG